MSEYFGPLRRRFGVATLMVACMITAMWLRSFTTRDRIMAWKNHSVYSSAGCFSWNVTYNDYSSRPMGQAEVEALVLGKNFDPVRHIKQKAHWGYCGLEYSDQVIIVNGVRQVWISHWYFITPLTVLSAWLLLSKVHKLNSDGANCEIVSVNRE